MTPNNGAFNSLGEIYSLKKCFWTNNMQRGAKIVPIQFDEFFQSEHNCVTSTQLINRTSLVSRCHPTLLVTRSHPLKGRPLSWHVTLHISFCLFVCLFVCLLSIDVFLKFIQMVIYMVIYQDCSFLTLSSKPLYVNIII